MNLTGKRFGRLTVLSENPTPYVSPGGHKSPRWDCVCDCGNHITLPQYTLLRGKSGTLSCGCAPRLKGGWTQNYKTCPVCGKRFASAPSAKKVTCSPECSRVRFPQTHGKSNPWGKAARERKKENVIKNMDKFCLEFIHEGNLSSEKVWILKSPSGEIYEFENLKRFARESGLFANPTSAVANLCKKGSYMGWEVVYKGTDTEWRKAREGKTAKSSTDEN